MQPDLTRDYPYAGAQIEMARRRLVALLAIRQTPDGRALIDDAIRSKKTRNERDDDRLVIMEMLNGLETETPEIDEWVSADDTLARDGEAVWQDPRD